MAALGGSRHALINLSTQIDILPIIKKSLFPVTGYSGHEDEQSHHLNTSYASLAPVCVLQTGAFCILRNFFKKIFAFVRRLKKSSVLSREKGRYYRLSTERR